jgi:hypothetical protein
VDGDDLYLYHRPVSLRRALATLLVVIAVGSGLAVFSVIQFGPSDCKHRVERPTARGALLAYYEECGDRPHDIRGPIVGAQNGWHETQQFGLVHDGHTWFVQVGQKTADSGWKVISENSGP